MLSHFSCVQLSAIPWTAAQQSPLSTGIFQEEHWGGLPCPPPGALSSPGIKPAPPALQADSSLMSPLGSASYGLKGSIYLLDFSLLKRTELILAVELWKMIQ